MKPSTAVAATEIRVPSKLALNPGLGDQQHGYPLDTYSESRRTARPSTARTTVRAIRLLIASKGSAV